MIRHFVSYSTLSPTVWYYEWDTTTDILTRYTYSGTDGYGYEIHCNTSMARTMILNCQEHQAYEELI